MSDKPLPKPIIIHFHDDVISWKHFPRYWPFVRGIHRSPVNSPHKCQWRGTMMGFFFICARINCWVNNREAGGLRRHRAHHDVFVMSKSILTILEHIYKKQILFESVLFLADASLGLPCLPLLGFCGKKKPIRYMLLISTTLLCCTMSLRNTYAHY